MRRVTTACVLLATAVPGLLFSPVFGLGPLVLPIFAVLVACYAVAELSWRFDSLVPWRPLLAAVAGLIALLCVLYGVPTLDSIHAFATAATNSWQLALESTWPVHPDPGMLLFVPLAVLLAAVIGVELLRWSALAVVPSVGVLVLSQLYQAATGPVATVVALGYAVIASALFALSRPRPDVPVSSAGARPHRLTAVLLAVPTLVLGTVVAVGVTTFDQGQQPAFSLHQNHSAPVQLNGVVSPLDDVAQRLSQPDVPVFRYTASGQVDRWRQVVLDDFDGVNWSGDSSYEWMGTTVATPSMVTVPTITRSARITLPDNDVWVPSQAMPATVDGLAPMIEPDTGVLLAPDRNGTVSYDLSWHDPQVGAKQLVDAALAPDAVRAGDLGVIPPGVAELARTATGGHRPSFQTALALEQYLSQNYHLATGSDLPTGSGWPQLRDFLLTTKRGTSVQFAASYVALARIVGIPARLAVGFRAPKAGAGDVVVHNGDALAWPEVAVAGVGWVPLDPSGSASAAGAQPTGLARAAEQARKQFQQNNNLTEQPLPRRPDPSPPVSPPWWLLWVLAGVVGAAVLAIVAVPATKLVRTWRRRRQTGAAGVVAAWAEARDLLRDHGVPVTVGMTVRDLAGVVPDRSGVDGALLLADQVDIALWSGLGATPDNVGLAWQGVRIIRRGLKGSVLRALFNPRGLIDGRKLPTLPRVTVTVPTIVE